MKISEFLGIREIKNNLVRRTLLGFLVGFLIILGVTLLVLIGWGIMEGVLFLIGVIIDLVWFWVMLFVLGLILIFYGIGRKIEKDEMGELAAKKQTTGQKSNKNDKS